MCLAGYLLGSINSAIIVSHLLYRKDIRLQGSGNAGMTNMLRVYGKKAGGLTALGDLLKAVLAVLLARWIMAQSAGSLPLDPGYLAGLFVLIGHVFPLYFRFRGGKGVMPALGIVLLVDLAAFLILLAVAVPVLLVSRTMSLVSLISALLLPAVTWILSRVRQADPLYAVLLTLLYAILVIVSHRENIKRLIRRSEKPIIEDQNED
jgi:glycerol-3-phosphate acyltransferase PlsY